MELNCSVIDDVRAFTSLSKKAFDLLSTDPVGVMLCVNKEYQEIYEQAYKIKCNYMAKCHNNADIVELYGKLVDALDKEDYIACIEIKSEIIAFNCEVNNTAKNVVEIV